MRPRSVTRTLVTTAVVFAVGAGGVLTAGTAAAAPAEKPTVHSESVAPLAVVNLGLNTTQAKKLQRQLKEFYGYTGAIDGLLGAESWKAQQRMLRNHYQYTGPIDGIVGTGTVKALQRLLRYWGYTGPIDGIAGAGTQAAFIRYADHL